MDIFFQSIDTSNKIRLHFHRFMQNLHNDMNRMAKQEDPIKKIVEKLAKETDVLCFDEFFGVFTICVTEPNRHPRVASFYENDFLPISRTSWLHTMIIALC